MTARFRPRRGADGGWCRRRSSKPFRGADRVPGGFDSHTLPSIVRTLQLASVLGAATVLAPARAWSQEDAAPPADSAAAAIQDSAVSPVLAAPTTVAGTPIAERRGPSPMGAFFRSVLVPGWGQLYADQPVRAAFWFTVQSATVFMVVRTQKRLNEAEDEGAEDLADSRRDQREDWLVLAGFWALASGIDAWVSANMWGFEGEVVPPPDGSAGLALQVRFPVSGF